MPGFLPHAMHKAIRRIESGEPVFEALDQLRSELVDQGFGSVDYATLADAQSLEPLDLLGERPARLLVAARIGNNAADRQHGGGAHAKVAKRQSGDISHARIVDARLRLMALALPSGRV